VLSAKLDGIVFPQKRVYFELVDRRFHFWVSQQVFEMSF
jgi:hypothetical protein